MSEIVVDGLEVVNVKNRYRKIYGGSAANIGVELFLVFHIRLLVLYARERICVDFLFSRTKLAGLFLFARQHFLEPFALILLFVLDNEGVKQTAAQQKAH